MNYPNDFDLLANGLGYSTTQAALGFPAGGLGPDNRISFYGGDAWKIKPNFTLSYGLRYNRDTGRTDSQYPAIPGLNALMPGLGNPVNQPNNNWSPQLGFAWDPTKDGKTSIRGGIGLFFENAIWNNVLFDGPKREATGAFLQFARHLRSSGSANTHPHCKRYIFSTRPEARARSQSAALRMLRASRLSAMPYQRSSHCSRPTWRVHP